MNGTENIKIEALDLSVWKYGNYIITAPVDCMDEGNADIYEEKFKVKWKDVEKLIEEK